MVRTQGERKRRGRTFTCNGLAMEGRGRPRRRIGYPEVRPINGGVSAGKSR
jgi:hypothetical protein